VTTRKVLAPALLAARHQLGSPPVLAVRRQSPTRLAFGASKRGFDAMKADWHGVRRRMNTGWRLSLVGTPLASDRV